METVHTETINGITYTLAIAREETAVMGNALASGNDAEDREAEDAILARLDNGETWAWAIVRVTASIDIDGSTEHDPAETFEGTDYLGACSYADTAAFMASGGYYDDMKDLAREDLIRSMERAVKRGTLAQSAIDRFGAKQ